MLRDPQVLFAGAGLGLAEEIIEYREHQVEAIEWALEQEAPYLLINAPTGSGKTLLLATLGVLSKRTWTYLVGTKRLQDQVAKDFTGLPVLKGRGNFPCWLAEDAGRPDVTAAEGICVVDEWCQHTGMDGPEGEEAAPLCPYYAQRTEATTTGQRCTNYAMWLGYYPLRKVTRGYETTSMLLADEAHGIEDAVCDHAHLYVSARTAGRFGLVPPHTQDLDHWGNWAATHLKLLPKQKKGERPDFGLKTLRETLTTLRNFDQAQGNWLVEHEEHGTKFRPIWGAGLVVPKLILPVGKVVMTSATLMGADFYTDSLGLPEGSWAYLDIPSTFPASHRPINYAPVVRMNAAAMVPGENAVRAKMQSAMDGIIDSYVGRGVISGLIHAVSKKYLAYILTESRYGFMMVSDPAEHERRVRSGEASILVAANLMEGWDGKDGLCRFILMPKVPFPDLGDRRTKIRMEEDSRSYDHKALVAVVQGVGRGCRNTEDWCDSWILDENWRFIYAKRRGWLPRSFLDAYKHSVRLPA